MPNEKQPESSKPHNRLGLGALVCLVIGNMIGTGIYVSSGYSLSDLKDAKYVMLVWLIAGVHAICGAVSYAAVAKRLPVSGGEYTILTRWVHPLLGFLAACVSIVAGFAAPIALSALLLGKYATHPMQGNEAFAFVQTIPNLGLWIATLAVLAAAILHWIEIGLNAAANNIAVAIKLVGLAIFIVLGMIHIWNQPQDGLVVPQTATGAPSLNSLDAAPIAVGVLIWGMLGSLYYTTLSYTGFNASIYLAGHYEDTDGTQARRSVNSQVVGRSMIYACVGVTIIYLCLNYVFLYSIPANEVIAAGEAFVLEVAKAVGGPWLHFFMGWVIALSCLTSVLAMTITGPQVYLQLGSDYGLTRKIPSERSRTRLAISIQCILTIAFIWLGTIQNLVTYLGLTLTACGALAIASIWIAQRKQGTAFRALSMVEHACIAIYVTGAIGLLAMGYWLVNTQFWCCVATFGLSIALYAIIGGFRKKSS